MSNFLQIILHVNCLFLCHFLICPSKYHSDAKHLIITWHHKYAEVSFSFLFECLSLFCLCSLHFCFVTGMSSESKCIMYVCSGLLRMWANSFLWELIQQLRPCCIKLLALFFIRTLKLISASFRFLLTTQPLWVLGEA